VSIRSVGGVNDIREVDPTDEVLLRTLWQIGAAVAGEVPMVHDHASWPAWRWQWRNRTADADRSIFAAYEGDEPVGYAEISLPLLDNPELAEIEVCVAAAARRCGHGSALLERVVSQIRGAGRRIVFGGMTVPLDGVRVGQQFAEARGFAVAQFDIEKTLDVRAHQADWRAMLLEVEPRSADYHLVSWVGETPAAYVAAQCELMSGFNSEIPLGELELEDEFWDPDRLRTWERELAETGKHRCATLALGPDGSAAGFTEILVDDEISGIGFQESTLAVPAHRGHRLGLRLKLVNQLRMVEDFPEVHTVETGNAGDNDHMNAVNELLGFRPAARWLEMQRKL